MKGRLERAFANIAEDASDRAAPLVTDAVRVIGFQNATDFGQTLVRAGL